jgi:hypothetical protein
MKIDQLRRLKKLGGDKSEPLEEKPEGTHPTAKSRSGIKPVFFEAACFSHAAESV